MPDSGLKRVGLYYEGIVDDVNLVRQKHQADTVYLWGSKVTVLSWVQCGHTKQE